MFIATMYSYGSDNNAVGVDGIIGCMGLFVAHNNRLHAIHIPDTPNHFATGRQAFVNYLTHLPGGFNGANARIYAVLNGSNRSNAYAEVLEYCEDLNINKTTMIRLRKHLGGSGSGQGSAAVLCELVPGSNPCRIKYQLASDVNWANGQGTARTGYYHMNSFTDVLSCNGALGQGWHLADDQNCDITTKN